MSEPFLSFDHEGRRDGSPPTLVAAIDHGIYEEIDERNGWSEPDDVKSELHDELLKVAARGFNELILFCFQGNRLDETGAGIQLAFQKFIAVAHNVNSEALQNAVGTPLSLHQLSELPSVNASPKELRKFADEFMDRWGFRARIQKRR